MYRYFLAVLSLLIVNSTMEAKKAPFVSLEEKNKQADTAFIQWRLNASRSTLSLAMRKTLTPKVVAFIVNETQLPLDRYMTKMALQKKVQLVAQRTLDRFFPKKNLHQREELVGLISAILLPEYELQIDPRASKESDKSYNDFLRTLSLYKTPSGKTLNIWALRFLTSESQFVALKIIESSSQNGKHFNALSLSGKKEILATATSVVVNRFMENLEPVRNKFGFELPPHLSMAIKERISTFLSEKFL